MDSVQQEAMERASELENLLGVCSTNGKSEAIAKAFVSTAHRTNQQSTVRFFMALAREMAAANRFDQRNEMATKICQAIVAAPGTNENLPYV